MRGRIITAVLLGALVVTATASADQVPEDCQGNGLRLDIIRDRSVVRVGETAVFSVYASNDGLSACNITDAAIYVEVPGADGNPVGEAQATTLSTGENFSAGASNRLIGKVRAVLNVNADVTDAVVRAFTHGVLHDASTNHDAAIQKTLGTEIARPAIAIAKVGSTAGGPAPQTVTYTYTVKNTTTPTKLADRFTQLANVAPTDDLCQPLSYQSGDANNDKMLQLSETWTYTCVSNFPNPGVFVNTAKVCAESIIDKISQNYCSPPATWKVTVTPTGTTPSPPAPPVTVTPRSTPPASAAPPAAAVQQGTVKPSAPATCTLSTPSGLKVRKGEVTTIKLTVRNVDAGSVAKITLPGGKTLTAKTNAKGAATFRVRPTRTGTAKINVANCSDVEHFTISRARRTSSPRVPRVTG